MTEDILDVALARALADLDISRRLWLIGVAHLAGVPETAEFTADEVKGIIERAAGVTGFPTGPVGFAPGGYAQQAAPDYRKVTLSGGAAAPYLETQLGLGIPGFVGVGSTRSGRFEDGHVEDGAIVLTDYEAVLADTFVLSLTAAVHLGYHGPINMAFTVGHAIPGVTPMLYVVDEDTGRRRRQHVLLEELPVFKHTLVFTEESTPYLIHRDLDALGQRVAEQFGLDHSQLLSLLDQHSPEYDDIPMRRE